jgi:CBS domain-containing protein
VDHTRATRLAAAIGQGFALLFGLAGILAANAVLVLIAVFVFLGAAGEAAQAQMQAAFRGLPTSSGMMTELKTLRPEDTLGHAVELLLSGNQVDFPVVEANKVSGILTRHQLVDSLRSGGLDTPVKDAPLKPVNPVKASDPLFRTWEEMARQGMSCLPVFDGEQLVGWITSENIAELAMVREALGEPRESGKSF